MDVEIRTIDGQMIKGEMDVASIRALVEDLTKDERGYLVVAGPKALAIKKTAIASIIEK